MGIKLEVSRRSPQTKPEKLFSQSQKDFAEPGIESMKGNLGVVRRHSAETKPDGGSGGDPASLASYVEAASNPPIAA